MLCGQEKTKNRTDKPGNLNRVNSPIKILGIYIGYNSEECDKFNWESKLMNFERLLNTWKG